MRFVFLYLTGLVFGVGIALSGMMNPLKVLNFFDVAGRWDPSLVFVMGAAVAVTFIGYRLVLRGPRPMFERGFSLPTNRQIDRRLIGGSALFGVGWGMAGFCPGASIPALGTGAPAVYLFTAALLTGIAIAKALMRRSADKVALKPKQA